MPVPAMNAPLLQAQDVRKTFVRGGGWWWEASRTQALRGVSLTLNQGEILGIVGESGCGKSTLARVIVGLEAPDSGSLHLHGASLFGAGPSRPVPAHRRGIQMVFQDPYASLNPRMSVGAVVAEGLAIQGVGRSERNERVAQVLQLVGLKATDAERYPHQFSGGQRQRIGIARALVMEPKVLIADEAVSALDVSVQMQILNLLLSIRDRLGIGLLFISHDIGVIEYLCDRVIVLSQGEVVEEGPTAQVINAPDHAYTKRLIEAVPRL